MPDLSGSVKENWGEKSVSNENKRTPEVDQNRQILTKKIKRRGSHMLHRWFSLPNFYRGQKTAILGIHVLTPKTPLQLRP